MLKYLNLIFIIQILFNNQIFSSDNSNPNPDDLKELEVRGKQEKEDQEIEVQNSNIQEENQEQRRNEIIKKLCCILNPKALVKAVSWRIIGTLITGVVAYILTEDASFTLKLTGAETGIKIIAYYLHEQGFDFDWKGCCIKCKNKCCNKK